MTTAAGITEEAFRLGYLDWRKRRAYGYALNAWGPYLTLDSARYGYWWGWATARAEGEREGREEGTWARKTW